MPVAIRMLLGLAPENHEPFQHALLEVRIEATMPPMEVGSTGMRRGRVAEEAPCTRCGRGGWFDDPEQPFTPLTKSLLAGQRLIVRRRVYELCRRLKVRGIRFSPVALS